MKNIKFSRQPLAYITLLVLLGQTYLDIKHGNFQPSKDLWDQIMTAAGAVVVWTKVTPVADPKLP